MDLAAAHQTRLRRAIVPLVAAAVTTALLALPAGPGYEREVWPFGVLLLGAGVAALVWWRERPRLMLAATAAVALTYYLAGFPPGPETTPFVVALFAVAAAGRRVLAAAGAGAALLVVAYADASWRSAEQLTDLAGVATTLIAVVALAEAHRSRRAFLAQSRQHAADAERLRIARELHDAVSHHLTVINLHAEAAIARHDTRPELALTALTTISTASREALRDIRTTLGAVRHPDGVPLESNLSLADLPRLAERVCASGAAVTVTVPGPPAPLPAAVERAVVRIAQEALTNATRHAQPRDVTLTVAYEPQAVLLDVVNDGIRPGGPNDGSGLRGMQERAEALGGRLRAGPDGGGRFRVHACLPWRVTP
ncbi:sensor histidine kinase [Catellatospora methionotrophica]|uniref:sensor histidine kinase n=1 Tax=Catellatospora methionotrophica TaxID=121620 RepID=UPI0033C84C8A